MHYDPKETNFTTHSPEGSSDEPEAPVDFNKEFTPSVPLLLPTSTASQTADEETSITSEPTQQNQTSEALSTSSRLSP